MSATSSTSSNLSLIALSENDKLRGYENYIAWKTLMEAHGRPKGLHKYWENKITVPTSTPTIVITSETTPISTTINPSPTPVHSTTPSELEYELRESVALSSILINVVDISGSGLDPSGTSHKAWTLLLDQYGKTSDRARNMREEALASCKMEEGGKVAGEGGHIERMRTLRKLANDTGADIKDSRFITKLLDSFPESWDAVITPMYSETNLSTVIMNLTTHAERLAIRNARTKPEAHVDTVKALETTVIALQAEMKTLKSNRGTPNPNKAHLKCTNTQCGKTGHLVDDCFQPGGGKAGQYPPWWKGKRTQTPSVPSANLTTSSIAAGDVTTGGHYALSALLDIRDIEDFITQNIPVERKVALTVAENPGTLSMGTACVADSGCTTHFFKSREAFSSYKSLEKAAGQSSKEGTNFTVLGMGTVQMKVVYNGLEQTLTFRDALHAPDVTANLISISRLDLAGWDIVFGGRKTRFFKDKKEIFRGILKNGLYLVGGSFISNIPTALTARSLRSPGDIALWHHRFGHFGIGRIVEASKHVNGLEITSKDIIGKCEDCIIGNQKRRPYDEDIIPETEVLRLTNIDIWGPARVQSTGGAFYAMKFHDSGSSHRRSFFLKDRTSNTVINSLNLYKSQSESVTGKKMIYIRTDNAPEFAGSPWITFCNENGIIMVPTAPYSSGSNGTTERSIGITTGSVRIMLNDANLSAKWWAEAWAYSEMVENLLPSTRHPGVIPEEKFTGKKQDVGHLRVWGCITFVYIPSEKGGGKLGDRGQKGRLLGMEGRGIYRVLIPETSQIIRSRNVVFEEGFGHRTLTAEGEYFADNEDNVDTNYEFLIEDPVKDPLMPAETPAETVQIEKPKVSRPRIIYPPASRKSARLQATTGNTIDDTTVPVINEDNNQNEGDNQTALVVNIPSEPLNKFVPSTFAEAFDISRRHLWMPAMDNEIERWDNRGVVTAVPRPKGIKTIKGKWVFDLKVDGDGNLLRRRARGVVKGFTQKFGEHWWDSFAAVVRYESIRMLFALTASKGLEMWLIDFVGAYLNSEPQGDNYMEIPEGFEKHYAIPGVDTVLKMNLTIYGTMDGANNWFHELDSTFTKLNYRQSRADPCIRIQWTKDGGYSITGTYTDDVTGASSSTEVMKTAKSELANAYEITDLDRPNKVLGMTIFHHPSGNVSIHQRPLILKIINVFGMENANPKYTPLPPNINLIDTQPIPIPASHAEFMQDKDYRKATGMLNYIANGTRPDISFTVNTLMRFNNDPRPFHWTLVKHCIAYLKTTVNLVITYRKGVDIKPYGFADASYADDPDSRKSTAGYVFMSAGGPVSWKSTTQRRISTSTGEAEYVSTCESGKQARWMYSWYTEVDQSFDLPIIIYCDNDAAVTATQNTSGHSKLKHVDIKIHWIREAVKLGFIHVAPISTDENIADIFTKSLSRPKLEYLINKLGMEFLNT
jgi:hypothetical protein